MKKILNSKFFIPLFIVLLFIIFLTIFPIIICSGSSMNPTYKNGNVLLTSRNVNTINRNDVIIFSLKKERINLNRKIDKENDFVKRVVAIPGDKVVINEGKISVNGTKEKGNLTKMNYSGFLNDEIILKKDEFIVIGDNRNNSFDSRYFGVIYRNEIKSKVVGKF